MSTPSMRPSASGPLAAPGMSGPGGPATGGDDSSGSGDDSSSGHPRVLVVGPDGMAQGGDEAAESVSDLVAQPAKVMRIGTMIKQLLDEVKAAPLDVASRVRLTEIYRSSIHELEDGLAPELVEELERLSLPFEEGHTPSEAELRIAQAQLVGWLEGLFHGIQTALFAQQMAARAQFEHMRRALPPGSQPGQPDPGPPADRPAGGMYL